jgi:hypothetical protein
MRGQARRREMKRDASKEKFWRQAIAKARSSGQSVREFCRQRGLRENLFYWWRLELKRRGAEAAGKSGFVELVRPAAALVLAGVSIRVDERVSIVLERGFDREALRAALNCLRLEERGAEAQGEARGP